MPTRASISTMKSSSRGAGGSNTSGAFHEKRGCAEVRCSTKAGGIIMTAASAESAYRLGVDIGGTFTDVVLMSTDGTIFSKKVLSTPQDYSQAIETGISSLLGELGVDPAEIAEFVHATTVAT